MGLFGKNPYIPPFDGIPHYTKPPRDTEAWLDEVFNGSPVVAFTAGLRFMLKMAGPIGRGAAERGYRVEPSVGQSPIQTFRLREDSNDSITDCSW